MLTVSELIGLLQRFPGGVPVVVRAYESGVDDAVPPELIRIDLNARDDEDWWNGQHQTIKDEQGVPAVFIGSSKRGPE